MEARISNAKQLKLSCQLTDNNNEDRISSLPDPVLHHILSSLDINHAIQTSLLSRRWRYLWTSISALNFNAKLFVSSDQTPGFNDFVDRVLLLHDGSNIESFRLNCREYNSVADRLNAWILVALRQNVRKLCFEISVDQIPPLPSCLFTCKSLTTLRLSTSGDECTDFVLPDSVSLPALKVLRLEEFILDDESLFHKLFSSCCPVLEWLYISNCVLEIPNLNISSPSLKFFRLEIFHRGSGYLTEGKIKLCAPNLINLVCADFISKDYSLENLSSLETADIYMGREVEDYESELTLEMKKLYAPRMMRYLRALYNVKELTLYESFLEVISRSPELLNNQPMQFLNLRVLEMSTWLSRDCIHAIIYMLEISPNIETLTLRIYQKPVKDPSNPIYPYLDEINLGSANTEEYRESGLLLNHLKFVEIEDAIGSVNELRFLQILLKNAMALQTVKLLVLSSNEESYGRVSRRTKFCETLLKFPRASASVAILFIS